MIYFLALLPATVLTIAGYFVLFLSNRSEGALRAFGKYLGFWAFTLAGLVILGAIFAAAHGRHHGGMMDGPGMYGRMRGFWQGDPRFLGPHRGEEPCGAPSAAPPNTAPPSAVPPSPH
ncbi:MAG TPA: hypothetical protein VK251_03055 [Steroidobacteraceae bacterium]|nr:hypothetical protein [Steroidobacteraceae bacterium]